MSKKTLEQCAQERDHLYMISHPEIWGGEILCLRHKTFRMEDPDGQKGLAFMIQYRGPNLHLGNAWMSGTGEEKAYPSFQAIIDDGWEVD